MQIRNKIVDRGAGAHSNNVVFNVRTFFRWAVAEGIIQTDPTVGVRPRTKAEERDRTLSDHEIELFWPACDEIGYPFGPLFQLLLLLGQREREVGELTWHELDEHVLQWTLPKKRAKNGRQHIVPLPGVVAEKIKQLPRIGKSGFLFTTNGKSPVVGYQYAKKRVHQLMLGLARQQLQMAGGDPNDAIIPDWTIHDLRRTASTGMARLKIPLHIIEKILNHVSGKISGVAADYNKYDYLDECREALEKWASYVNGVVDRGQVGGHGTCR